MTCCRCLCKVCCVDRGHRRWSGSPAGIPPARARRPGRVSSCSARPARSPAWCTMPHRCCTDAAPRLPREPALSPGSARLLGCPSPSAAPALSSSPRLAAPARAAHLGAPWCTMPHRAETHQSTLAGGPAGAAAARQAARPRALGGAARRGRGLRARGPRRRRGAASARRRRASKRAAAGGRRPSTWARREARPCPCAASMCVLAGLAGPEPPAPSRGF